MVLGLLEEGGGVDEVELPTGVVGGVDADEFATA